MAVLSEPWVVGKTASRYRGRGELRECDERELILCNLCVRRSAFEEAGGFDERLYPNEENALLERLRTGGSKLIYEPGAIVRRPHRESLREYVRSIYRYGRGRGEQLRCLPSWVSLLRILWVSAGAILILLALSGTLVSGASALALPLALYPLYLALIALRSMKHRGPGRGLAVACLAALTHAAYALGALVGVLGGGRSQEGRAVRLEHVKTGKQRQRRSRRNAAETRRTKGTERNYPAGVMS